MRRYTKAYRERERRRQEWHAFLERQLTQEIANLWDHPEANWWTWNREGMLKAGILIRRKGFYLKKGLTLEQAKAAYKALTLARLYGG